MKKIQLLTTLCFLLFTLLVNAQIPPNAFNYSAVARNAAGQPIATTTVGIQITILKTSPTGASQYSENHFVNTDAFGLFNLVIGAGAVQSGSMATIDWSNDDYYLKVGMDAAGGTNFLTMGSTQLLSVPYAMYAKSAGSVSGGSSSGNFTHFIGESFGGGVIFHLWKDNVGNEHGLIVDTDTLTYLVNGYIDNSWSNITTLIGASAQSSYDGLSNSIAIVGQAGHTYSAAATCLNSNNGGYSDWYLPSIQEIGLLMNNNFTVALSLSQIPNSIPLDRSMIWSSSESYGAGGSALQSSLFGYVTIGQRQKNLYCDIRAVRSF
jgi:hypothetical protein